MSDMIIEFFAHRANRFFPMFRRNGTYVTIAVVAAIIFGHTTKESHAIQIVQGEVKSNQSAIDAAIGQISAERASFERGFISLEEKNDQRLRSLEEAVVSVLKGIKEENTNQISEMNDVLLAASEDTKSAVDSALVSMESTTTAAINLAKEEMVRSVGEVKAFLEEEVEGFGDIAQASIDAEIRSFCSDAARDTRRDLADLLDSDQIPNDGPLAASIRLWTNLSGAEAYYSFSKPCGRHVIYYDTFSEAFERIKGYRSVVVKTLNAIEAPIEPKVRGNLLDSDTVGFFEN